MTATGSGGLPTPRNVQDLFKTIKKWQTKLNPLVKQAKTPVAPFNFAASRQRGGILLTWAVVKGADGYEILRSDDGNFGSALTIPVRNGSQTSYFDELGGTTGGTGPITKWYKIRATTGAFSSPASVKGVLSGAVTTSSIDPTDTATASTTTFDGATSDGTRSAASRGRVFL